MKTLILAAMTRHRGFGLWSALTFTLLLLGINRAQAMPASPHAVFEQQPDGSAIELRIRGDEFFNWIEDADGYTVVRDRGWFVFGRLDSRGQLVSTQMVVGRDDPRSAGLRKRSLPAPSMAGRALMSHRSSRGADRAPQTTGTLKNLVILLRFSNHATRALPSESDVDVLFNAADGDPALAPTGSVRDVYLENSYGQLTVDSTVAYWIDLPQTEQYYASGNSGLVPKIHEALRFALDVLDANAAIDFRDFDQDGDGRIDAITFLHSSYGAEWGGSDADGTNYRDRIWSHKWTILGGDWVGSDGVRVSDYHISPALWGKSGSDIGRVGVICHELGHFLGLPDLYDTDSYGSGIGSYGLMANSWGFDGSQHYPPHLSAWSKIQLGFLTPTVITPGDHTLEMVETSPSVYRIDLGYPAAEYLLIENRQPVGMDGDMPQGGLAIWHIDEQASFNTEGHPGQPGWPQNGNHYRVALLQADGSYGLEMGLNRGDAYDLYHAGRVSEIGTMTLPNTDAYQYGDIIATENRISNISASGPTMTFTFANDGDVEPRGFLISGKKLIVKDKHGDSSMRAIVLLSKDSSISTPARGSAGDPTKGGAQLRLNNPSTLEDEVINFPSGGWTGLGSPSGSNGYRYMDKTLANGPCRLVLVKAGQIKALCKGAQIGFTLDEPAQRSLAVTLRLGTDLPYCMEFGGQIKRDRPALNGRTGQFSAIYAPAPRGCPVP